MKEKSEFDVGVIVGRFQVPELHEAHRELVDSVKARHPRVIIVLGMSVVQGTRNNPLDFASRKQMIQEAYPDIDVVYVKDCKSDEAWSRRLDEVVRDLVGPNLTAVLYGSRGSFISSYHGSFKTLELVANRFISGTEVRAQISKKAKPSYDWRAGAIWQAFNQFPKVWTTVDIAIMRNSFKEVLLGRKSSERGFRFIGGFSDPQSNCYEDDAIRETMEETELSVHGMKYIGSDRIDDWRYRGEVDCIKTMMFVCEVNDDRQEAKAADDIAEVRWFNLSDLKQEDLEPEHGPLLSMLKLNLGERGLWFDEKNTEGKAVKA